MGKFNLCGATVLLLAITNSVRGQTIDQLILLAQEPADASKAIMQSPDSDTVMVELDMIYNKDTWQEMQRSRVELEEDYDDYSIDFDSTDTDTDSDTEESTESTESTDESTDTESTDTESTDTESHSGPGRHGHSHSRSRSHSESGPGRHRHRHSESGPGRRRHGKHGRHGRHRSGGHGTHGRNVYPRRHKRKAIKPLIYRWTNKEVPYQILSVFTPEERQQISAAIADWERYTCLKFVPKGVKENYVNIVAGSGCSSMVGMVGGAQALSLGLGCRVKSVVLHELGHAIGFQHEQTRPDRDGFVTVHRQNIYPGMEHNFQRYDTTMVNDYSIPYDYLSVMHYGQYAFSVNGKRTIRTSDSSYQSKIGTAQGLSFRDIKLANLMYQCNSTCRRRTCPESGFQGKDCKCWCKGNPIRECDDTDDNVGDGDETITEEETCLDSHPRCSTWAAGGECSLNPGYMLKFCQKSCDSCRTDTGEEACEDVDKQHCPYWSRNGYCNHSVYKMYMELNCARSCFKCGISPTSIIPTAVPAECKDKCKIKCAIRKLLGQCRRNTEYMQTNCRKTCGYC